MDVERIYRARNYYGTEVLHDGRLTTWKSTALCGVELEIGKTYIVTGILNPIQMDLHKHQSISANTMLTLIMCSSRAAS